MPDAPATGDGPDAPPTGEPSPVLAALAAASQHVTIGMAVRAPDCLLTDINPAYCRMLGYEREELLALDIAAIAHPDDQAIGVRWWRRLAAGELDSYQREKRYLRKDGSVLWGLITVSALRDEHGGFAGGLVQVQDITAQKTAEAALRESEAHLRTIVEQMPVAVYRLEPGPSGRYSYTSPRFTELTGLTLDFHDGDIETYLTRVHPDDVETVREGDASAGQTGLPLDLEYRLHSHDGTWIWVHDRSTLTRDARGNPLAWYGVLLDISERKRLEASLRDSRERFRRAFEDAPIGMSLGTPDDIFLDANAAYCRIVGRPREALIGRTFAEFTHPDDVEAYVRQHARLYSNEVAAYQMEKRYLRPDGTVVTGLLTVSAVRDDTGAHLYDIGQLQDITAQKAAEAALRESEARFRSIFEGAGIGMTLASPERTILVANPALGRILGYAPEELVGIGIDDISVPVALDQQQANRRRLRAGDIDAYQIEKRYQRKDGVLIWALVNVAAIRDEHSALIATTGQIQDITIRKEAEAALAESEALFRSIFEGAGIGMALSGPDGRMRVANPAFERLLGYAPGELAGIHVNDITLSDDLPQQTNNLRRARAGEIDAYQMEKRYLRKDGAVVWGLLHASVVRDDQGAMRAIVGQVQDITARREAEAALRESEARFRALVQNDPDVIAVVDDAMRLIYLSPSAEPVSGIPAEEMLGSIESALLFVHPEDQERTLALFDAVTGQPRAVTSAEARIKHAKLGWRWYQITIMNLLEDPSICGYLFNLRDITDRKHAELASEAALQAQQAAIAELERLNQSKTRFLSTISHEFRTPLTAIIGYSELLARSVSDPAIAEDAAIIHREASRLNRLVDDILLVDRVDAGHMSLKMRPVDVNGLVRDVVATFRPLTDSHRFPLDLDPSLRPIDGDRDRLAQAITNLVSNAVKYSPAGGTVTIATRNDGDDVVISVRDEGIGIAGEDLSRIFDRFERVETGIAGRIAGTGLGLSIVQEIVSLHGGRLWAESELGLGSTFYLAIPAARSRKS